MYVLTCILGTIVISIRKGVRRVSNHSLSYNSHQQPHNNLFFKTVTPDSHDLMFLIYVTSVDIFLNMNCSEILDLITRFKIYVMHVKNVFELCSLYIDLQSSSKNAFDANVRWFGCLMAFFVDHLFPSSVEGAISNILEFELHSNRNNQTTYFLMFSAISFCVRVIKLY